MDMGLIAFVWKWCIPRHGNLCIGKLVIIHYPLFFGGGTCFSNKPICCHQKTEVSWVLYQSPENPSGMYGFKICLGSDSKCGFHRILFIYHLFEVKFRTEGYLCCVFFFSRQVLESFWVPGSMISCFCFSCFFASLLYLVLFFSASLLSPLLCFCASVPFNFTLYMFFSLVMCFCCSTSCSFASLLSVFTASLFFLFFCFILSCLYPKWNPKDPRWNPKKP